MRQNFRTLIVSEWKRSESLLFEDLPNSRRTEVRLSLFESFADLIDGMILMASVDNLRHRRESVHPTAKRTEQHATPMNQAHTIHRVHAALAAICPAECAGLKAPSVMS